MSAEIEKFSEDSAISLSLNSPDLTIQSNQTDLVATLEIVPVRKAFPHEAINFTPWLENNIEALSQRLNLSLTVIEREKVVGDFFLDLLCQDAEGKRVIIENQLERSDHSHLGQLLTYLVNLNAATAIWVTPEPRAEHQKVVTWLNESTPTAISFYLVRVEAVRIKNSPFAPLFTVIAGPDRQSKEIGAEKKEWDARQLGQFEFWKSFIELAKTKIPAIANRTPSKSYFFSIPSGKSGLTYFFNVYAERSEVDFYIDFGKNSNQKNKLAFDNLMTKKVFIDKEVGNNLSWERQDNERASHLRLKFKGGYQSPHSNWPTIQETMIKAYLELSNGLKPFLNSL